MQLSRSTNIATGEMRYHADGRRITFERYQELWGATAKVSALATTRTIYGWRHTASLSHADG